MNAHGPHRPGDRSALRGSLPERGRTNLFAEPSTRDVDGHRAGEMTSAGTSKVAGDWPVVADLTRSMSRVLALAGTADCPGGAQPAVRRYVVIEAITAMPALRVEHVERVELHGPRRAESVHGGRRRTSSLHLLWRC